MYWGGSEYFGVWGVALIANILSTLMLYFHHVTNAFSPSIKARVQEEK